MPGLFYFEVQKFEQDKAMPGILSSFSNSLISASTPAGLRPEDPRTTFKGQLISKCAFCVNRLDQNTNQFSSKITSVSLKFEPQATHEM